MKAKYDTEEITITPRFKAALIELMKAECGMMAKNAPEYANCWTWGHCEIHDLAHTNGLQFQFGGDKEMPEGPRFQVYPSGS